MTIFRVIPIKQSFHSHKYNYAQIKFIMEGKGIWLYAFSRPDDWKFYMNDLIQKSTDGERSLIAGLKIREYGYYIDSKTNEKVN